MNKLIFFHPLSRNVHRYLDLLAEVHENDQVQEYIVISQQSANEKLR